MKHYLVLVEVEDTSGPHYVFAFDQPIPPRWCNRYTISVPDDDPDFRLVDYVNGLVFATQFLTNAGCWIKRVIVLDHDRLKPFDSTTPAHLFSDGTLWRPNLTEDFIQIFQKGLTEAGTNFTGLVVLKNRLEGAASRKFYRGCYSTADMAPWTAQKYPQLIPIVRLDGPLLSYWFHLHRFCMEQLPYVDSIGDVDAAGNLTLYEPPDGELVPGYAMHLATERRKRMRMTDDERLFENYIEGALDLVQSSLEAYEFTMWGYNHQWGDGMMPGGYPTDPYHINPQDPHGGTTVPHWLQSFAVAASVWYWLSLALDLEIDDDLGIPDATLFPMSGAVASIPLLGGLWWTGQHLHLANNEEAVMNCLQRLFELDRWYQQTVLPLMTPASQAKPYPQWPQQRALELYNIWDEITAWMFEIKSVLCVLYSIVNLKIPRRSAPHTNHPQPKLQTFAGVTEQTWTAEWQTWLPKFRECVPWPREPFLTLNPLPDATAAINLVQPPLPPWVWHPSQRQLLMMALRKLDPLPTHEQMCEFVKDLKQLYDIVLNPGEWLVKAIIDKILSWLGIEFSWDSVDVTRPGGPPPPPPADGAPPPSKLKGWKLNVDWVQLLIDYECPPE